MNARPLNFVSLFAGIGGLDLGLERAGMKCVAQVEINPFCRRVLARHWPDVPRYEDVRTINADTFQGVRIDLIAGGFPCQDISRAGNMAGIDDGERSGLWRDFYRLIREIRPIFALVENVSALLDGGIGRVLGDLAEGGYDAEWDCLPSGAFGSVHSRDRVFVLAYDSDSQHVGTFRRCAGQREKASAIGGVQRQGALWLPWRDSPRSGWRGYWANEPAVGRVAHGVPNRVDRLHAIGNAVVPQVAEWIGRRIVEAANACEVSEVA